MRSIRGWRPRHLLAAWSVYWLSLATVTLGPVVRAIWHATRPEGNGSVSASMGDGGLKLIVTAQQGAATLWSGNVSLTSLALWIAGPPLLLYVAWVMLHRRSAREARSIRDQQDAALPDAPGSTARAALRDASPQTIVPPVPDKATLEKHRRP